MAWPPSMLSHSVCHELHTQFYVLNTHNMRLGCKHSSISLHVNMQADLLGGKCVTGCFGRSVNFAGGIVVLLVGGFLVLEGKPPPRRPHPMSNDTLQPSVNPCRRNGEGYTPYSIVIYRAMVSYSVVIEPVGSRGVTTCLVSRLHILDPIPFCLCRLQVTVFDQGP